MIWITIFSTGDEEYSSWEADRPDADTVNNTTFIYNRNISLPLDEQRKRLPIFKYKQHILYLLEKYQTLVLVGDTGCGKSTQVPQVRQVVRI